ncbi:hypothetical protein [uncultured Chryseobacterium sp.]|uniref:hypothetical protein n=1 Tax=uncultured Chryseobacterium sp. TaxID=259322 RepID=UPI0025D90B7D|nr:hypothetical protein [uncultured Chryseobacterium sp.]
MKINGFNNYDLDGSFIYFIFSKELLYIGETQKITFSRWVQHFYKQGTFTSKIQKYGDPDIDYFKHINLLSVELNDIRENFLEHRWKIITQAVEHSLHEVLITSRSQLLKTYYEKYEPHVDIYKIVSDTSRTAPRNLPKDESIFVKKYTNEILGEIYNFL